MENSPPQPRLNNKQPYKVQLRIKAAGNAPILKQQVFKLSSSNQFHKVIMFIRKEIGLDKKDSLYVYVNSAFIPTPSDLLGDLDAMFSIENVLNIQYSTTPAWG